MVGGGPMFVTVNGFAYQRFDWPQIIAEADRREKEKENPQPISEEDIEAAEFKAFEDQIRKSKEASAKVAVPDLQPFKESLSDADREAFSQWYLDNEVDGLDAMITMPESNNPTYIAFNHTAQNDRQLKSWYEDSQPRLEAVAAKWRDLDVSTATCETLLAAIVDMGIEEGHYWSGGSSHTFGVAKSTDDQLQCFLREVLPDHNFISGQFLTGIDSKTMQSNRDLFEIAKLCSC